MSEPIPRRRWVRILALALLGAIGLAVQARPALAMGCHAPDRPTLGLDYSRITRPVASTMLARMPQQYAPTPCTGNVPTAPERFAPISPLASLAPFLTPSDPREARSLGADSDPLSPSRHLARLDRPPRTGG